jgi:hypothetical protein
MNDCMTECLTDYMIDYMTNCISDCMTDYKIDYITGYLPDYLIDWMVDCMTNYVTDYMNNQLIDCLTKIKSGEELRKRWIIDENELGQLIEGENSFKNQKNMTSKIAPDGLYDDQDLNKEIKDKPVFQQNSSRSGVVAIDDSEEVHGAFFKGKFTGEG